MTDDEKREAKRVRDRENARKYYQANREKILARAKERDREKLKIYARKHYENNKEKLLAKAQKWREANKEHLQEYSKQYYEENKDTIAERGRQWFMNNKEKRAASNKVWLESNREHVNELRRKQNERKYQKELEQRAESALITVGQGAAMLGLSHRSFTKWVTDGVIAHTRTPTGRRMVARADVEALIKTQEQVSDDSKGTTGQLRVVRKVGQFTVPDNFDLITEYAELTEYTLAFAAKAIGFLLLVGSPGSGKSKQMQNDLRGKACTWIDNHVTNLGLYCSVYEAGGRPVVLDDVNHFLKNKTACSLIKAMTQTDERKHISWESPVKYLEEREVPREYDTTSPVCLIGNLWDSSNADYAAIQDRALPVAFFPSAETIHNRVIELGWCKDAEILDFVGENLVDIPQPSMREYYQAMTYKRAGMAWQQKLKSLWGQHEG